MNNFEIGNHYFIARYRDLELTLLKIETVVFIKNIEIVHSWSAQSGIMKGDLAKKIYEGIRSGLQKT